MSAPAPETPGRTIVHVDMDCFYAAVEVREQPALRGLPVAVGGSSRRGVLTTCSYEARAFGCRSAMPVFEALRLCPQLVLLPVRFELYQRESRRIRAILQRHARLVEPLSLDEAYLDVSDSPRAGIEVAAAVRAEIRAETGLTASAGVGPNKLLAKIASDWRKPDGLFEIRAGEAEAFLGPLPVRRLWGIGPRGEERLAARGVRTIAELRALPEAVLRELFGRFGAELLDLARGIDARPVEPDRPRRSTSVERTFERPLRTLEECRAVLLPLVRELRSDVWRHAADRPIASAVVKVKFDDFRRTTRERLCPQPRRSVFEELLAEAWGRHSRPARLLGVGVRFADESAPGHRRPDGPDDPRQLELGLE